MLRLPIYSSQSPWWSSAYPYTDHSLLGGPQTIPLHMKVHLVVPRLSLCTSVSLVPLRLSLYSSQTPWWYSDYRYTHRSLPGGNQTIPLLLTVCLWNTDYPYTHHSLPGGTQTIPIHITVSLVVLRVSIYSSQSPWWKSDYPGTHHRLPPCTQTIPVLIRVSPVVLRIILYSSQSPWCYSDYPYTHHGFTDDSNYPYTKHSLPVVLTLSLYTLAVLRLPLYTSQSP